MTKEKIEALKKEPINNWSFTHDIIDAIMAENLGGDKVWDSLTFEIAKAQRLLNLYMTSFKLKNNQAVYEHIKRARMCDNGIDYDWLQRYLVETYYIIKGDLELWHKKYRQQYMRDRMFFALDVEITNVLVKCHCPETDSRNLMGFGAVFNKQRAVKSAGGQNNNKKRRESILAVIKQPGFFDGCKAIPQKLLRIKKESKKHPTASGHPAEVTDKTARRYLKMIEQ